MGCSQVLAAFSRAVLFAGDEDRDGEKLRVCSTDLCLSKMDLILCTMNSLTLICNFQKV